MYRDGPNANGNPHPNPRSLLERVGGPAGRGQKNFQRDEVQARIDNIIGNSPEANMMMAQGFPGMGMDMNAMAAANMANPIMLQEMMMNQMALMAQMASTMGIINPATGQFGGQGFPMQGVMPNDMGMFQNNMNNNFPQQQQQGGGTNGQMNGTGGRGRGTGTRNGRGAGRGRGGSTSGGSGPSKIANASSMDSPISHAVPVVAPTPITPTPSTTSISATPHAPPTQPRPAYAIPERPQSPTLCKFGPKCTNVHCRYSHPSPVATAESGVVLSNEACDQGKDCKDKDCVKAHVSPAVLNPQGKRSSNDFLPFHHTDESSFSAEQPTLNVTVPAPQSHHAPSHHTPTIPCRFGAACTRPGCTFSHPARATHSAAACRFGAGCTRGNCTFQHPEGRVLPSSFHRGLSTTGPMVNVPTPETGSMGGASQHRSVTFNNPNAMKEKLEKQMKEIQEKKDEAEKAVKEAEAAANSKKTAADAKTVPITA